MDIDKSFYLDVYGSTMSVRDKLTDLLLNQHAVNDSRKDL